jgi:hypothetical protein
MTRTGASPSWRPRVLLDTVTLLAFLGAIVAPIVDAWVRPDSARGTAREERAPAPRPEFQLQSRELATFPERYEAYFNDSFGLRDKLLRWHSLEKVLLFAASPTGELYLGRDWRREPWVFYASEHSLTNHRGLWPFAENELAQWAAGLETASRRVKSIGAHYLFVIIPNKESVYPERVPERYNRVGPTRAEQLTAWLREHRSPVDVLDLKDALVAEKANDPPDEYLYTRLGTHWNGRGSFVCARAILAHLAERVPGIVAPRTEDYVRKLVDDTRDTWGRRMFVEDLLPEDIFVYEPKAGWHSRVLSEDYSGGERVRETSREDAASPRAVILHDSFLPYVQGIFAEQFSYTKTYWLFSRPLAELELAHPDVVIAMYAERMLNHMGGADHMIPQAGPDWRRLYARSSEVVWAPDLSSGSADFDVRGEIQLEPMTDAFGPALAIQTRTPLDKFVLPEFTPPATGVAVARLVIDSPVNTTLKLHIRQTRVDGQFHKYVRQARLQIGRNELYFGLDVPIEPSSPVLAPGEAPGTYKLRAIDARRVDLDPSR